VYPGILLSYETFIVCGIVSGTSLVMKMCGSFYHKN